GRPAWQLRLCRRGEPARRGARSGAARAGRRRRGPRSGGPAVIPGRQYPAEPWCIREVGLDMTTLAQTESLFALSNGHIGVRGNLAEGDPYGLPGTYLNSFYEPRPLPYAEAGYGYAESGQTILNVTDGKVIRLLVDDEPFDLRYGTIQEHQRTLDLRR